MKKGFTLVELIATIIVLGIIGLIAYPIMSSTIKNNKEKLYETQIKVIHQASEDWAYKNVDLLPDENETITITILDLKRAGLLDLNIKNPKTNELFPNDLQITIAHNNKGYTYTVDMESGTNISNDFSMNSPTLILNGNAIEYIEVGSTYNELGAQAKGKNGNTINNINITYQYNGTQIASINTMQFKTYTIIYSVSDVVEGTTYTTSITRTLIVRDTTAPDLTIPGQADITLSQVNGFDLTTGVTVTDNSGETIEVNATSLENKTGKQIVSYTACDSHNNCVTKKRIVNVTE